MCDRSNERLTRVPKAQVGASLIVSNRATYSTIASSRLFEAIADDNRRSFAVYLSVYFTLSPMCGSLYYMYFVLSLRISRRATFSFPVN
jgi:hypothetical protein